MLYFWPVITPETERPFSKKIVVLGGGSQFNLLCGLVKLNNPELITAMPGSWDSGGSSGRLRTTLGSLPPGDARQCLIGLMEQERQQVWSIRESDDRFHDHVGPLKGHDFINLEIDLLSRLAGSFQGGLDAFREKYGIRGRVIPSSTVSLHLSARLESGKIIDGERAIDTRAERKGFNPKDSITSIWLNTPPDANKLAIEAITEADIISFAPGSLWTSILPHLLMRDVKEAIHNSKAKVILNQNLMTERGQTDFYDTSDHLEKFLYYFGDRDRLDYMVVSPNGVPERIIDYYARFNQFPVEINDDILEKCHKMAPGLTIVQEPLAFFTEEEDLLRHDPQKLAHLNLKLAI
jgi:uncharacterized cofD-like protein